MKPTVLDSPLDYSMGVRARLRLLAHFLGFSQGYYTAPGGLFWVTYEDRGIGFHGRLWNEYGLQVVWLPRSKWSFSQRYGHQKPVWRNLFIKVLRPSPVKLDKPASEYEVERALYKELGPRGIKPPKK